MKTNCTSHAADNNAVRPILTKRTERVKLLNQKELILKILKSFIPGLGGPPITEFGHERSNQAGRGLKRTEQVNLLIVKGLADFKQNELNELTL